MSGHNKWSKVKHKKAATDAVKSKTFTKIVRLLNMEAKKANGDTNSPGLKAAIERARAENLPRENIERAIKKGGGEDSVKLEAVTYEAYGPGGCAIIIEVLTDNRNKASAEIKHILSLHELELAGIGAAAWAFQKNGAAWIPQVKIPLGEEDRSKLDEIVNNLDENDEVQDVFTNAE
ncbi:MAG: YebC/PmpR family DNA-binding transcriptional regulator [Patescibacteria group bacterium]